MNTLKTTMSKIAQIEQPERTDLAKHEVEWANINQLVKLVDSAEKTLKQFNSLYDQVDKLKPQIIKAGDEIVNLQKEMNMMAGTFEKQFSELGLKFSDYPEYKRVSNFMSTSRMVGDMTRMIKQV